MIEAESSDRVIEQLSKIEPEWCRVEAGIERSLSSVSDLRRSWLAALFYLLLAPKRGVPRAIVTKIVNDGWRMLHGKRVTVLAMDHGLDLAVRLCREAAWIDPVANRIAYSLIFSACFFRDTWTSPATGEEWGISDADLRSEFSRLLIDLRALIRVCRRPGHELTVRINDSWPFAASRPTTDHAGRMRPGIEVEIPPLAGHSRVYDLRNLGLSWRRIVEESESGGVSLSSMSAALGFEVASWKELDALLEAAWRRAPFHGSVAVWKADPVTTWNYSSFAARLLRRYRSDYPLHEGEPLAILNILGRARGTGPGVVTEDDELLTLRHRQWARSVVCDGSRLVGLSAAGEDLRTSGRNVG